MLNKSAKRGSALVMALVTALVLSILVGALFLLFQSNVASYEWTLEEMQAMYTAEAGANLATYMILQGVDVPLDSCYQFLPETGTGWVDLPGDDLGEVKVWVDPHQDNEEICSANAYVVKARGRINTDAGSYEYGMETMLMPENFSRFS